MHRHVIDLQLQNPRDLLLQVNHLRKGNRSIILENYSQSLGSIYSDDNSKIYHLTREFLQSTNVQLSQGISETVSREDAISFLGKISLLTVISGREIQEMSRKLVYYSQRDLGFLERHMFIQSLYSANLSSKSTEPIFKTDLDALRNALKEIKPTNAQMLEFEKIPEVYFKDIYGLQHVLKELETIISRHQENSIHGSNNGIIIHGDSGVGKSALAFALVNDMSCPCIYVDAPRIRSKILGESESNIRAVFSQAKSCMPSVILVDQIDMILPLRGSNESSENTGDRITACFLSDEVFSLGNPLFVIGITNRLEAVDPSVYRPGRLHHLIRIPMPDFLSRKLIFTGFLSKMPNSLSDSDIHDLATASDGWTGADIENLLREAALKLIRKNHGIYNKDLHLTAQDFDAFLNRDAF